MTKPQLIMCPSRFLVEEATTIAQQKRGLIYQMDEPTLVVLYGEDGYARAVGVNLGMILNPPLRKCLLQEHAALAMRAQMIAPNLLVKHRIQDPLERGQIRVVSVGHDCVMVYDLSLSHIFSMLN